VREKLKNLAILEAIVCPDWELRYFSYNGTWGNGVEMASMRDGCGSEWFTWFKGNATAYKCFSPEDGLMTNLDAIKKEFPAVFAGFVNECAFSMQHATCLWYKESSQWVKFGNEVVHSIGLEQVLSWEAKDYCSWAREYYERELSERLVAKVLEGQRNETIVIQINPALEWNTFVTELAEMGA